MSTQAETDKQITIIRKRRGTSRASITRLRTRLHDLKDKMDQPETRDHVRRMIQRLESLDLELKQHHYALVDLLEGEEPLEREQEYLDEYEEDVANIAVGMEQLLSICSEPSSTNALKIMSRKLNHLQRNIVAVSEALAELPDSPDICLLHQYEEQLQGYKVELSGIRGELLSFDADEEDELYVLQSKLEEALFDSSLKIRQLLKCGFRESAVSSATSSKGVKLPQIDVPTFDGNIVNWRSFWEQFCVSVHSRSNLSDSEKLVYLQHSLKDSVAKHAIEGLSHSGDYYIEAIESLQSRYDRPRVIHQTHVKMIAEAPVLKDGSGRELRRLHDTVQQHLRALRAMEYEPSGPFVTSLLELKLDVNTMFEWQKHSQAKTEVPHYQELLEFLNVRAQASETPNADNKRSRNDMTFGKKNHSNSKSVTSFTVSTHDQIVSSCVVCKTERHPLYLCPRFKSFTHDRMIPVLKANGMCMNCLRPGHFLKQCNSQQRCRKCGRPHHTLLHVDPIVEKPSVPPPQSVTSHASMGLQSSSPLMTCRILIDAPDGSTVQARALLDSASSASFISERMTQSLCLTRTHHVTHISGIAGLTHKSPTQSIATFKFASTFSPHKKFSANAIVIPRVTCDLPVHPIPFNEKWTHLNDLQIADPEFNTPGRIDVLLGVDVFVNVLLNGRRVGPSGSPIALETELGWVLAGKMENHSPSDPVVALHSCVESGDDLIRRFWEIEENFKDVVLSPEEKLVAKHFNSNHSRTPDGRFIVPLPRNPKAKSIGESRSSAIRRFLSLERSLTAKGQYSEFTRVMEEYLQLEHAELVPVTDLRKPPNKVFYLPVHVVRKESSTTTKVRAVFDASAKSATGISLNDTLLVGSTVHSSLVDVLLRFRFYRFALTTDVSKMYRAVKLSHSDKDYHRFVWRRSQNDPILDYRMTRITFGVSASSFAANMAVKQNALEFAVEFPLAAKAVCESFYVDDGLVGADTIETAVELQDQLQNLFSRGGFLLHKWKTNEPSILSHLSSELTESNSIQLISDPNQYSKTLGIEWHATTDNFRITIAPLPPPLENVTKRFLVSDIAKTYDVLGWFAPTIITVKILLQRAWELKIGWDEVVPDSICSDWSRWRSELGLLSEKLIPRCYYPREMKFKNVQLHGFCDASESAYAAVIYLRMMDDNGNLHVSLVTSKTKVAPIKRLTIPRLELCGAFLLSQLLHHLKEVFHLSMDDIHAWTDSTIVLQWLSGNPRRFKTFVGNRVSSIVDCMPPGRWSHVKGLENPADCASRGIFPSELLEHDLWWEGPEWLKSHQSEWPRQFVLPPVASPIEEEREICFVSVNQSSMCTPILLIENFSSFTRLKRITAWVLRFINNCRVNRRDNLTPYLLVNELVTAENYWISVVQNDYFADEIEKIENSQSLSNKSCLLSVRPFIDSNKLLRVSGRIPTSSSLNEDVIHPIILHGKHLVTKLIVRTEHIRLLHAGPTLLTSVLCARFHIIGCRRIVRSITRGCVICRRQTLKSTPPLMGKLPLERVTPGPVFDKVGVDFAGPIYIKYGYVRKPTVIKSYICVFVSLSVKAVHLELVSDMSSESFIASLRRFVSRRGKPSCIWSDHGTNFVGANRELREFVSFLQQMRTQKTISEFCASQNIHWSFIPERAPHFGGLWEAAVKSMKTHLRKVTTDVKLTFEEYYTVLTQVEACMNSRPLVPLSSDDEIAALTPGHFLIGRPIESLPDPPQSYQSISILRRWHLVQAIVKHFWKRWSSEYLVTLRKFTKWHRPSRNLSVGDVVVLQEDNLVPMKWPIARVVEVYTGDDNIVRVVKVKTPQRTYKRPVTKIALLLPESSDN